jgi:hypothetical protein
VECHDSPQGEAGHDDEGEGFVSHFYKLTTKLGKFERGPEGIDDNPQAEQPHLSDELEYFTEPAHVPSPVLPSRLRDDRSPGIELSGRWRDQETPKTQIPT